MTPLGNPFSKKNGALLGPKCANYIFQGVRDTRAKKITTHTEPGRSAFSGFQESRRIRSVRLCLKLRNRNENPVGPLSLDHETQGANPVCFLKLRFLVHCTPVGREGPHRGTSLIRTLPHVGPYSSPVPRDSDPRKVGVSDQRATPVRAPKGARVCDSFQQIPTKARNSVTHGACGVQTLHS